MRPLDACQMTVLNDLQTFLNSRSPTPRRLNAGVRPAMTSLALSTPLRPATVEGPQPAVPRCAISSDGP